MVKDYSCSFTIISFQLRGLTLNCLCICIINLLYDPMPKLFTKTYSRAACCYRQSNIPSCADGEDCPSSIQRLPITDNKQTHSYLLSPSTSWDQPAEKAWAAIWCIPASIKSSNQTLWRQCDSMDLVSSLLLTCYSTFSTLFLVFVHSPHDIFFYYYFFI